MMERRCRCGIMMRFVGTAKSGGKKSMPLDARPVDPQSYPDLKGIFVIEGEGTEERCRKATPLDVAEGARLYLTHFSNCPYSDTFSRNR